MHRDERGLPLPILKRSVSDFDCTPVDGKGFGGEAQPLVNTFYWLNPNKAHEQYGSGYIIITDIVINLAFWTIVSYALLYSAGKGKHKHE
jgi:hypothetical protein